MSALPEWADEWGPVGVKCCGRRTVRSHSWGSNPVVCQVSGWQIEACAERTARENRSAPNTEGEGT